MSSSVLSDIKIYEAKPSIFNIFNRSDKTRMHCEFLNCFKNDRSSKFNWGSNFKKIRCVSRELAYGP